MGRRNWVGWAGMLKTRLYALSLLIALGLLCAWVISDQRPFRLGLDLSGGAALTYKADTSLVPADDRQPSLSVLRDVIERRVNLFGVAEPTVYLTRARLGTDGTEDRLVVELPGVTNLDDAVATIGSVPVLDFRVENPNPGVISITPADIQNGTINVDAIAGAATEYIPTDLTGRFLKRADVEFDPTTNRPIVALTFNQEGGDLFAKITRENVGKTIAIYLDGESISAPRVNEEITGGSAVISGNFTAQEAKALVNRMNAGALPVPISLIQTESLGPTLGQAAIADGMQAGIIGFIAIAVLLLVWYRLPGFIAIIGLVSYGILMLVVIKLLPITLTASGIAGLVLSLGMAVDANILVFERMKEELRAGKAVPEALTLGFDRAWNSIRDGNLSSLISAVALFIFGTSLIKGFALTFGVGVLISMLSAITVSRVFLRAALGRGEGRIIRFLVGSGFSFKKS
jgi:preprotein translocase subunit SecD